MIGRPHLLARSIAAWAALSLAGLAVLAQATPALPITAVHDAAVVTDLSDSGQHVLIDPHGVTVFSSAGPGDWRSSVQAYLAGRSTQITGGTLLLVDSQGRAWVQPGGSGGDGEIDYFDGQNWAVRKVGDLPDSPKRDARHVQFLGQAIEDAAGEVFLVDGSTSQGWWLHRLKKSGKWDTTFLTERTTFKRPGAAPIALQFEPPVLQIGGDGLLYAAWKSTRTDSGIGASGFTQIGPTTATDYFYPAGSSKADYLDQIIPLPDGSLGLVRADQPPRLVWMSTAAALPPPPDLPAILDKLGSQSPRERDAANDQLIAMGPRVRAPLQELLKEDDDPETSSRITQILSQLSTSPPTGVFGNRFMFAAWKPLAVARKSANVYLTVTACRELADPKSPAAEHVLRIDRNGVWSIVDPPTLTVSPAQFKLVEDDSGVRWWLLPHGGLYRDDNGETTVIATCTDTPQHPVTLTGVDREGAIYLQMDERVFKVKPSGPFSR